MTQICGNNAIKILQISDCKQILGCGFDPITNGRCLNVEFHPLPRTGGEASGSHREPDASFKSA